MLRTLRYALLALLGLVLLVLALSNRETVTLRLLPEETGAFLGVSWVTIQLPLFLVIFAGLLAGIAVGFLWEWVREGKHRSAAQVNRRRAAKLEYEVSRLREDHAAPEDEVVALLEGGRRTR